MPRSPELEIADKLSEIWVMFDDFSLLQQIGKDSLRQAGAKRGAARSGAFVRVRSRPYTDERALPPAPGAIVDPVRGGHNAGDFA